MADENTQGQTASRFGLRFFLYLLLFVILAGLIVLWFSRTSIADNFIRAELDKLDIEASYDVEDVGFNKQVVRNLVLGDPGRPDLTADMVEVGNSLTLEGAGINWVQASGVKLYGRFADGKLSFGELDKFTDPQDDSPLALPDIWAGLNDARLRIDSDYGAIGMALNGKGNLQDGFRGELAMVSRQLDAGNCNISGPTYFGTVAIDAKKPRLKGPLRLPQFSCPELSLAGENLAARVDMELGEDFTNWDGDIGLIGGPLRYAKYSAQEIKTSLTLKGDMRQSSGDIDLTASGLISPYGGANIGRFNGPFQMGYAGAQMTASFEGKPSLQSVRISSGLIQKANILASSAQNSPAGPLANKLVAAIKRAGKNLDVVADIQFETGAKGTSLLLGSLDASSRSGAKLSLRDPMLVAFAGSNVILDGESDLRLKDGGFPNTKLVLDNGSLANGFAGRVEMASYEAGGAALNIPGLGFSPARGGGTNFDGRLMLTGPISDGKITGLQVPVNGYLGANGSFALFRQCISLQFASLRSGSLSAGPTQARLCPQRKQAIVSSRGGGVNVAANAPSLRLAGAVGGTPLSISSNALGFSLSKGVSARDVSVRLGAAGSQSEFEMAVLTAAFGRQITGKISGAKGKVANVPLLMDEVSGDWSLVDGAFVADAAMRVRDEEQVERFRPLISDNVRLEFANGQITATGQLKEPTTGRDVARMDIDHSLGTNTGQALLNVQSLTFDEKFQPELLTPLVLGVIANVNGAVSGTGNINWDTSKDGVQSGGKFRTDSISLAAAFGPVTGLSGEIEFSDLLALETGAGQLVRIAEVNPGVAAFNGQLRYRLLPDYKMQIEGGEWPFAGGKLFLESTILDLGEDAERRLEFTVQGVDAGQFLTQFDFENLAATGIFDGKLPMVFDQDGGRIAGGYLEAREGGGSLAYVGELTYEDMGTFANFAFNALKSLKYKKLTIGMDGDIAGEIITEVKFAGLQQGDTASKNFVTKQLARIPLEFNVRIQAPFMQLMSSAKAYYEPERLVGQNLPALIRAQEALAQDAVQEIKEKAE